MPPSIRRVTTVPLAPKRLSDAVNMNTSFRLGPLRSLALAACLLGAVAARCSTYVFDFSNLNLAVPDGSSAGASVTRHLNLPPLPIVEVTVSFSVLPGYGPNVTTR